MRGKRETTDPGVTFSQELSSAAGLRLVHTRLVGIIYKPFSLLTLSKSRTRSGMIHAACEHRLNSIFITVNFVEFVRNRLGNQVGH